MFPPVSPDDRDLTSVFITLYLLNVIYVPNDIFTTQSLNLSFNTSSYQCRYLTEFT